MRGAQALADALLACVLRCCARPAWCVAPSAGRRSVGGSAPGLAGSWAALRGSLPTCPRAVLYAGAEHGDTLLAECNWGPTDGAAAGAFLAPWASTEELEGAVLDYTLTLALVGSKWEAYTVACESASVRGEYGLYAARDFGGGELVAAMMDGREVWRAGGGESLGAWLGTVPAAERAYLYELPAGGGRRKVMDGAWARHGGPKRANDPRGTGLGANCMFYDHGYMCVSPGKAVGRMRPGQSAGERRRSEILWAYGEAYWQGRAAAAAGLGAKRPRAA